MTTGESKYQQLNDKEWLYNKYCYEQKTIRDIANEIGCDARTVSRARTKLGIKSKTSSESRRLAKRINEYPLLKDGEWLYQKYWVEGRGASEIARIIGCHCHTSVTNALKKFGIAIRTLSEAQKGKELTEEHKRKLRDNILKVGKNTRFVEQPETKVKRKCAICGKQFWRYKSNIKSSSERCFCSQECYHLTRHEQDNPRWNGGRKDWFRKKVLGRDDHICQICGLRDATEGFMDIDHIIPRAVAPELKFDVNNGQTVCPNCHRRKSLEQKDYSHKNNNNKIA